MKLKLYYSPGRAGGLFTLKHTTEIRKSMISESEKQKRCALRSKSGNADSLMPEFFNGIAKVVEQAKAHIERSVNVAMCDEIGRLIVEQEQFGASRAAYGTKLLDELSAYLTDGFWIDYPKVLVFQIFAIAINRSVG